MPTPSGGSQLDRDKAAFKRLLSSELHGPVSLVFGGPPKADGTAEYRAVTIRREMVGDVVDLLEVWRRKANRRHSEAELREYDCAPQPEGMAKPQVLEVARNAHMRRALRALATPADLAPWTRNDPVVGMPRSCAITATLEGGETARFFRRIQRGKQLNLPGRLVVLFEGDRVSSLEDNNAILLEADFDCVEFDGRLFIFHPLGFEVLFTYDASLRETAEEVFGRISGHINPENLTSLRAAVAADKGLLRQIAGRIQVDLATADPEKIRSAIAQCHLNVTVTGSGRRFELSFPGDDPHDLIVLLTNRTVIAIVTDTPFIAGSLSAVR